MNGKRGPDSGPVVDEGPLVLRAGVLQRYLAQRELYVARTHLQGIRVVETRIHPERPLEFSGRLAPIHNGVVVSGTLTATWVAPCRRCNSEIVETVAWQFSEMFATEPTEGVSYQLGDESLDLRAMVQDQITLQLPLAPVCSDNCAGICSVCGTDLNKDRCDCNENLTDPRWDALSQLNLES